MVTCRESGSARRACFPIGVLLLLGFPYSAWANAGTPLMWATGLHMLFGNAVIGVFEGSILGVFFGVPKGKAIGMMILANYFSAGMGMIFLHIFNPASLMNLNNGWRWFWTLVVGTYVMTVFLEWPFIAWLMRRTENWLRRSLRASVIVQAASYIPLFGWYWMASGTSLFTDLRVVSPDELALPANITVYFISSSDGHVYRYLAANQQTERVVTLHSTNTDDRLFVHPNSGNTNHWDLAARLETGAYDKPQCTNLLQNMDVEAVTTARRWVDGLFEEPRNWLNFGAARRIGNAIENKWKFRTGFWPVEGLTAENMVTKETIQFSLETPFAAWETRNAVHLPSDKVLFQLGHDQICIFDPTTRKISLLCRGRGPVAVIENKPAKQ